MAILFMFEVVWAMRLWFIQVSNVTKNGSILWHMFCKYVSLMQNWELYFSCWPHHIDSIKPVVILRTNSQIVNVFYDNAVDLYNLYDEISLSLTNVALIYMYSFRINDPWDCWPSWPMIHWSIDYLGRWPFGPLTTALHVGISTFQANDPPGYRQVGPMILRTGDH